MFDNLSDKFSNIFQKLRGRGRITESDLKESLREVRLALLEADVNYNVVKNFLATVTDKAVGQDVLKSITAGQQVIKIVYDELVAVMGEGFSGLKLQGKPPWAIMLIGLQGSGKTTTAGKLALYLKKQGHFPYLVPADVARPAAITQLTKLAQEVNVPVYPSTVEMRPVEIVDSALKLCGSHGSDVVIIDTAGRLSIDEELMKELSELKAASNCVETLLVADAMTGQQAVGIATDFNQRLSLTGVILTKMEGDARGGAALSIKAVTGAALKFIGVGEKLDAFEPFHPDRMASLILGMGDVLSLIEKAQENIDEKEAQSMYSRMERGKFTLNDFRSQLNMIGKMGSVETLLSMIPGLGKLKKLKDATPDAKQIQKLTAMIDSMTIQERLDCRIIDNSRKRRIASGSGTTTSDVTKLLKSFTETQKLLRNASKPGLNGLLQRFTKTF
ncbi:MAG: signal recognition particle protein [Deltaproteobacteria bacterium]|jgi:signal recognition particle subunit SRP54|nr:signal recognition particle protein [Deltaproteobacteria bacterium]